MTPNLNVFAILNLTKNFLFPMILLPSLISLYNNENFILLQFCGDPIFFFFGGSGV
jgi:hypothetical protein